MCLFVDHKVGYILSYRQVHKKQEAILVLVRENNVHILCEHDKMDFLVP
jgi:hypothetical protein